MDKANMLIGPKDTLLNMSTLEPTTIGSTSTSEVRQEDRFDTIVIM